MLYRRMKPCGSMTLGTLEPDRLNVDIDLYIYTVYLNFFIIYSFYMPILYIAFIYFYT